MRITERLRCVSSLTVLSFLGGLSVVVTTSAQSYSTLNCANVGNCARSVQWATAGEEGTPVSVPPKTNYIFNSDVAAYYTGALVRVGGFVTSPGSGPLTSWPSWFISYPGQTYDVYVSGDNCGGYGPLDDGGDGPPPPTNCDCGCGGDGGGGGGPPPESGGPRSAFGMPVWRISEPYISLWLMDEPLGYQPSIGSRIALRLGYKQRESIAGMNPSIFSLGKKWNFPWLSYVALTPYSPDGTNVYSSNVVYFPGGGASIFPSTNDYRTNTRLTGSMTNGYTLYYPDGSIDSYGCIVNIGGLGEAFLTQHSNPQGQATTFVYNTNGSVIELTNVVDATGGTNRIYYGSTNQFSTNLITQVTDRYGRSAYFAYDTNGCLTNIIDVESLSSSMSYNSNYWITALNTPYGTTTFNLADAPPGDAPPNGRSALVTGPDGSSELYLGQDGAPGVAGSYATGAVPTTGPLPNMLDNTNLNLRNTFHWGKKQYSNLSTTNISALASNDFTLAGMKHWLLTGNDQIGQTLSMRRDPSPDNGGTIQGQVTWYDYAGKTNSEFEGAQFFPLITARVLPDGTTAFTFQARNATGAVITNVSTFGIGASTGLRTNVFTYGTNQIDVLTITNALNVQAASNAFNAYHEVVLNFDALNEETVYTYDTNQRQTSITFPTGLVRTNLYGSDGYLAEQADIGIATNYYTYANGLVSTQTSPLGMTVVNTYDNLQRLTSRNYPDGTYMSNQYTRLDLTATRDRLGNWTYYLNPA
jgi:YD repeat-containing protein